MKTENNNSKRYITNNLEKKQYLLIIMIVKFRCKLDLHQIIITKFYIS